MFKTVSLTLALLCLCAVARAEEEGKAKTYYDRGTAAFALGKYADAAAAYEKAFELRPDPAILYNAAQAHRLAGNKQRALDLYTSYLRIYGKGAPNKTEVQGHIVDLKKAIEHDARVANSPPLGTIPAKGDEHAAEMGSAETTPTTTAPTTPETTQPSTTTQPNLTPPPSVVDQPSTSGSLTAAPEKKPIYKKAWFWGAVGGGVAVVVIAVVLGVTLGGSSHVDPSPTYGTVRGN